MPLRWRFRKGRRLASNWLCLARTARPVGSFIWASRCPGKNRQRARREQKDAAPRLGLTAMPRGAHSIQRPDARATASEQQEKEAKQGGLPPLVERGQGH